MTRQRPRTGRGFTRWRSPETGDPSRVGDVRAHRDRDGCLRREFRSLSPGARGEVHRPLVVHRCSTRERGAGALCIDGKPTPTAGCQSRLEAGRLPRALRSPLLARLRGARHRNRCAAALRRRAADDDRDEHPRRRATHRARMAGPARRIGRRRLPRFPRGDRTRSARCGPDAPGRGGLGDLLDCRQECRRSQDRYRGRFPARGLDRSARDRFRRFFSLDQPTRSAARLGFRCRHLRTGLRDLVCGPA